MDTVIAQNRINFANCRYHVEQDAILDVSFWKLLLPNKTYKDHSTTMMLLADTHLTWKWESSKKPNARQCPDPGLWDTLQKQLLEVKLRNKRNSNNNQN